MRVETLGQKKKLVKKKKKKNFGGLGGREEGLGATPLDSPRKKEGIVSTEGRQSEPGSSVLGQRKEIAALRKGKILGGGVSRCVAHQKSLLF